MTKPEGEMIKLRSVFWFYFGGLKSYPQVGSARCFISFYLIYYLIGAGIWKMLLNFKILRSFLSTGTVSHIYISSVKHRWCLCEASLPLNLPMCETSIVKPQNLAMCETSMVDPSQIINFTGHNHQILICNFTTDNHMLFG